jgi:predicted Zn-dependent protease
MKREHLFLILLTVFIGACATVPITGRKQLNLVSPSEEKQLGQQAYAEVLKENPISKNEEWQKRLRRVGADIQRAANQPDFEWEFNVLQGKDVNAFCLPGGKVAFWEAIIPICGDDNGIAVVMGHEVAHALAHHGAERMSQTMGVGIVGQILSVGLGKMDPTKKDVALQAFGIGTNVGLLKYSRQHESEADHIGLILMAKAGYDPRAAVGFWRRMSAQAGGGKKPPEFLSTHPSDETRISQIEGWLPEALEHYHKK